MNTLIEKTDPIHADWVIQGTTYIYDTNPVGQVTYQYSYSTALTAPFLQPGGVALVTAKRIAWSAATTYNYLPTTGQNKLVTTQGVQTRSAIGHECLPHRGILLDPFHRWLPEGLLRLRRSG